MARIWNKFIQKLTLKPQRIWTNHRFSKIRNSNFLMSNWVRKPQVLPLLRIRILQQVKLRGDRLRSFRIKSCWNPRKLSQPREHRDYSKLMSSFNLRWLLGTESSWTQFNWLAPANLFRLKPGPSNSQFIFRSQRQKMRDLWPIIKSIKSFGMRRRTKLKKNGSGSMKLKLGALKKFISNKLNMI